MSITRLIYVVIGLPWTFHFSRIHRDAVESWFRGVIRNWTVRWRTWLVRTPVASWERAAGKRLQIAAKVSCGGRSGIRSASKLASALGRLQLLVSRVAAIGACAAASVVNNGMVFDPLNLSGQKQSKLGEPLNFMGVVRLLCIDTLVQVHNVRNTCQNIAANINGSAWVYQRLW